MANIAAIRSVGSSLAAYLNDAVFPPNVTKPECTFSLTSIGGIRAEDVQSTETSVRVLIFLYRSSMNHHLRNAGRTMDPAMHPVPLSVDLHYVVSFWAQSGENEQLAFAVYAELQRAAPKGLRYATFRLDDGVSFMHIVAHEEVDGGNALTALPAFQAFAAGVKDRCVEPPRRVALTKIGAYGFFGN